MSDFDTRIIAAPLPIAYEKIGDGARFREEFDLLSENSDDPLSAWLKNLRARGKIMDENEPIIQLLLELHRKVDALHSAINNERKSYLPLENSAKLESIGHSLLIFACDSLESGAKYYGRLDMAVFPARKIPLFFEAKDSKTATITLMHNRDIVDFDGYIASRERTLIREQKQRR